MSAESETTYRVNENAREPEQAAREQAEKAAAKGMACHVALERLTIPSSGGVEDGG